MTVSYPRALSVRAYACMPLFSFSWSKPVASDSTPLSDSGDRKKEKEREKGGGAGGRERERQKKRGRNARGPAHRNF